MRLSGTLKSWKDDRGFGFIEPAHGGAALFVHISALPGGAQGFRCDGRKYCSEMRSCTEAKFFLRNCPATEMD